MLVGGMLPGDNCAQHNLFSLVLSYAKVIYLLATFSSNSHVCIQNFLSPFQITLISKPRYMTEIPLAGFAL